jgi:drug/metabolite transporter (DMT)-like permease
VSDLRAGIVRCGAAAALFGASTPLAARLATTTSAPVLAGLLYLGAAGGVIPVVGRRPLAWRDAQRGARRLAVAVVVGGFLGPLLFAAGLSRTPGATASLLLNLELVATTVLAALFFGEHLGRRVAAGTLVVVLAGVLLAWSGTPELRLGALLIVGACVCWGLDNCITAALDVLAPEHITLAKGVIAGGTNLVLGLALGGSLPAPRDLVGALAIGALGYGASITLWVSGARELGAARGQLVFAAAPFLGVLVAWAALGDDVRGVEIAALVVAVAGVASVLGSAHEHRHRHLALEHSHAHDHDAHHQHDHGMEPVDPNARHAHAHAHVAIVHAHPHVPDLHHRHDHADG